MLPGREAPPRAGPPDLHRLAQEGVAGIPVGGHERHERPGLASVHFLRCPAAPSAQVSHSLDCLQFPGTKCQ
jgi:hypothetical protein